MQIKDFLSSGNTLNGVAGVSKKRVLDLIALKASEDCPLLDPDDVFESLCERERLGSTGLGEGVAIPHCRLEDCDHTIGILLKLEEPVDFSAPDQQPVDLVFALLVPQDNPDNHLLTLKAIAERFSNPEFREALRNCQSDNDLFTSVTASS